MKPFSILQVKRIQNHFWAISIEHQWHLFITEIFRMEYFQTNVIQTRSNLIPSDCSFCMWQSEKSFHKIHIHSPIRTQTTSINRKKISEENILEAKGIESSVSYFSLKLILKYGFLSSLSAGTKWSHWMFWKEESFWESKLTYQC